MAKKSIKIFKKPETETKNDLTSSENVIINIYYQNIVFFTLHPKIDKTRGVERCLVRIGFCQSVDVLKRDPSGLLVRGCFQLSKILCLATWCSYIMFLSAMYKSRNARHVTLLHTTYSTFAQKVNRRYPI